MKLKRALKNSFTFENGLTIGLNNEIISQYSLRKRDEISEKEYFEILEKMILSTSFYYLAKRDYSKKELYDKLFKKYWEKISINKVLEKLENLEYINDLEFAKSYVKNKKGSRKKIEFDLKIRGISNEFIKEALSSYEKSDELEELEREWNKLKNKDEQKKIISLMRKGFTYDDIRKFISKERES